MLTATQLPTEGRAVRSDAERESPSSVETDSHTSFQPQSGNPDGHGADHQKIAELAYSYWLSRAGAEGSAEEDWLRAERELRGARAE